MPSIPAWLQRNAHNSYWTLCVCCGIFLPKLVWNRPFRFWFRKFRPKSPIFQGCQKSPKFRWRFLQKSGRQLEAKNRPFGEKSPQLGTLYVADLMIIQKHILCYLLGVPGKCEVNITISHSFSLYMWHIHLLSLMIKLHITIFCVMQYWGWITYI